MSAVFTNQGRATSLSGVILPGLDVGAARRYAQGAQQNPPEYNFLALLPGSENCATFVCNEVHAAGGPALQTATPDALVDLWNPDLASYRFFTYDPNTGVQYQNSFAPTDSWAPPF
jgi:hypothetical protein